MVVAYTDQLTGHKEVIKTDRAELNDIIYQINVQTNYTEQYIYFPAARGCLKNGTHITTQNNPQKIQKIWRNVLHSISPQTNKAGVKAIETAHNIQSHGN